MCAIHNLQSIVTDCCKKYFLNIIKNITQNSVSQGLQPQTVNRLETFQPNDIKQYTSSSFSHPTCNPPIVANQLNDECSHTVLITDIIIVLSIRPKFTKKVTV